MKPCVRDVEEILAANQWAKRQEEAEAFREASRERMQKQVHKSRKKARGNRIMANLSFTIMGAASVFIGLCLAAGELGGAGVFGLIALAAIGGAVQYGD